MPEEIQDNQQQQSQTPHFDNFSGNADKPNPVATQENAFVDNESFSRPLINPSEPSADVDQTLAASNELTQPFTEFKTNTSAQQPPVFSQPQMINEPVLAQQPQAQQNFAPNPVPLVVPMQPNDTTVQPLDNSEKPVVAKTGIFKNKKLIIGIAIAVILVIITGFSVLAVNIYQSPQKVITDSIISAVTAKSAIYEGTLTSSNKDTKTDVSVKVTTKNTGVVGSLNAEVTVSVDGKKFAVNGDALVDKEGDLYFKVGGLQAMVDEFVKSSGISETYPKSVKSVNDIVKKIDGTWVRISSKDLETYGDQYSKAKTCINKATDQFKNDSVAIAEVTDLYKKHEFIVIDKSLGEKDGSFGYIIKGDNKEAKLFAEGLKATKIYKSLNSCDSSFAISEPGNFTAPVEEDGEQAVELWVNIWSHKITKISTSSNDGGTAMSFVLKPNYDQKVEIETPKTSITLSELKAYVEELMTAIQSDMSASSSYDYL